MTTIEKSIDVQAPVSRVYNQWTQFESFPAFMDGVERISQLTATRTHWETSIGGVRREFDAEITEQHPDERIAWRSVDGPEHGGVVTFHQLDDTLTRINLQMEYHPDSFAEKAVAALGVIGQRVNGDLTRFKEFIEDRGHETGAWRGDVPRAPQAGETPLPDSARSVPPQAPGPRPTRPDTLG
ncbi:MAG: SRPBCC family protein [Actinomycetota bacterium]|nr:SRPBCC family protein [Actinomycetota bacterium]